MLRAPLTGKTVRRSRYTQEELMAAPEKQVVGVLCVPLRGGGDLYGRRRLRGLRLSRCNETVPRGNRSSTSVQSNCEEDSVR